jgi:hypothetical protein
MRARGLALHASSGVVGQGERELPMQCVGVAAPFAAHSMRPLPRTLRPSLTPAKCSWQVLALLADSDVDAQEFLDLVDHLRLCVCVEGAIAGVSGHACGGVGDDTASSHTC